MVGLRSTLGGPDSLGGADADRAAPPMRHTKRIQFRRRGAGGIDAQVDPVESNKKPASRHCSGGNANPPPHQQPLFEIGFDLNLRVSSSGCRVRSEPVLHFRGDEGWIIDCWADVTIVLFMLHVSYYVKCITMLYPQPVSCSLSYLDSFKPH